MTAYLKQNPAFKVVSNVVAKKSCVFRSYYKKPMVPRTFDDLAR